MTNFGVQIFPTDQTIGPIELAKAVEERGLDSLFFPEHTHIPTSRKTPFPGGTDLPEWYWRTHDPFVALTAAAAVTSRIKIGTGICLVIERDPIVLAKECASLDVLSNGRFILGIGAGWNVEEMENHGASFKNRWKIVREKILAMREIWNKDEAEFHGEFVDFDPIWSWPKPLQAGGPPVWLGANSKWTFDRVAEYCDGWMPIGGMGRDGMENLNEACN
ncbi:MAG: putative F420-dependent oxidoreductase, partial [Candidatus Azotimanducaceae bacterium]